jgi:hypothetical protein
MESERMASCTHMMSINSTTLWKMQAMSRKQPIFILSSQEDSIMSRDSLPEFSGMALAARRRGDEKFPDSPVYKT